MKDIVTKPSLFLLALALLCGCGGREKTKTIDTAKHTAVDMGGCYLGAGGFLAYCEGEVAGIEMHRTQPPFFRLPGGASAEGSLSFFGSRGRGPNEFLMPYSIQHIAGRTVGVLDAMLNEYHEFDLPRGDELPTITKSVKFKSRSSRVLKTAFDQYIGLTFGERMFALLDSDGSTVDTFFEYPYEDAGERRIVSRAYAYQGSMAANPSKTRFVYTPFNGEIIHFYSIEKDRLNVIEKIEKEYPIYGDASQGDTQSVAFDAHGKNGYIALYATERFVYAIYSGQTVLEMTEKKATNYEGELLRVFDWSGAQVRELRLDIPCSYLCVSDDDTRMWAVATDASGEIVPVSFDLTASGSVAAAKPQAGGAQSVIPAAAPAGARVYNESAAPAGTTVYGLDVQTKDGAHNAETQKVIDSIRSLPPGVPLDLTPNDRYDVRIDTTGNAIIRVLILK